MFDKLKTVQALASLMKNKEQLAQAGQRVTDRLGAMRVEGRAGGGACKAVVDGKMKLHELSLEPALLAGMSVDEKTRELAQQLIIDAVNDATEAAQERAKEVITDEAKALGLDDLDLDRQGLTGLLG